MRAFTRVLLRHRAPALLLLAVLAALSLRALPRLELDLSIYPLLASSAEAYAALEELEARVPSQRWGCVVALEWPQPMRGAEVATVAEVERALAELPWIERTLSLASAPLIERRGPVPLPFDATALAADEPVAALVARHPLLGGRLVSRDGRAAALLVRVRADDWERREALFAELDARLDALLPAGVTHRLAGNSFVELAMRRHLRGDLVRTLLLEALFFLLAMPLLFRSVRATVLPLLVLAVALLLHFGVTVALGNAVNSLEIAIPGLMMMIGLCDAVHLLHAFELQLAAGAERRAAIVEAMAGVGTACFHTSFTTAVGFLSLLFADHAAVRGFGVHAALGVLIVFATVVVAVPIALSLWPVRRAAPARPGRFGASWSWRRPSGRAVAVGGALLLLPALLGLARLRVDAHWLDELPADDPAVVDLLWYEQHFGGALTLDVELAGELASAEAIAAVEALRDALLAEPDVTGADCYTDWIRELLGNPAEVDPAGLARGATALVGLRAALPESFPAHLVAPDMTRARLRFWTGDTGTARYFELRERATAAARDAAPAVRAEVGGPTDLAHASSRLVVTTLVQSLLLSLAAITLFLMIVYRSVLLGLVAIPSNALPIVAALGLTGLLGIELRIGIVMIYSLSLGLAVDDTIHVLSRFRDERRRRPHATTREQLDATLRSTGRALVATTLVIAGGALCYLPSGFRSMSEVGLLLSTVAIVALAADVCLLPLLIERVHRDE